MAITFSSARSFATANTPHMFYNVPVASQSFKIRVESATPAGIPGAVNVISRSIFDFIHSFTATPTATVNLNLQLNGLAGAIQCNVTLTIGTVYVICLVWNGTTGHQYCYLNGIPQTILGGPYSGNTNARVDSIQIGPLAAETAIVYTLGDYHEWDNYGLTLADAQILTNNGDPTTIGTSATWRCHWTLDGTVGATATIGDAGLNNAYGTGANLATAAGAGTAIYAAPLVWAPTVTSAPYVTGCGKIIAGTLALNTDGSPVVLSQLLTAPSLTVNGTNLGPLTKPWLTGFHQCFFYATPGDAMINPGDTVSLSAPPAWANTAAGPVAGLSGTIDNRSGRSSVGVDSLNKTLRLGFNLAPPGGLEYYPFRNAKFLVGLPGQFGKIPPGNGYQVVNQPCEDGLVLLVWNALKPATPAILSLSSGAPTMVTVTHLPQYDVSPLDGIGYVRVYQIAYVAGSAYETTTGGSIVVLNYTDPAYTGTSNYGDLWIYLAGEWELVNGVPVFDRSDPFALSNIFLDRLTQEVGSIRAVDTTACGGACLSFPYPELLLSRNVERFWGYDPIALSNVGFTSAGPVDVTATPYIYSAQFNQPANLFSATLSDTISTTPAVGTHETWHFSDGATAPLMAALEVQVDAEIVRILSGSGTTWVVYRGSNGTTPATHAPGAVTVSGRQPITTVVHADGTYPYTAPVFIQCNAPHGMTTGHGYYPVGTLAITMADGTVEPNLGLSRFWATGPTSFMSIWLGWYPSKPNGTKPSQTYTLNPAANYMQRFFFPGMPIDVYCELVGRFPHANLHINIPLDACDDLVYAYAWACRDHFPSGRKIYVEWANEPWNWSPPFAANRYCEDMAPLAMPSSLNTHDLAYYSYRDANVHAIFRSVFTAAGRLGEIVGCLNCQMNSGSTQITPYLNTGLAMGQPFDAVMCAPYYSMGISGSGLAATVAAFNLYDDDQAAEQLLHDITYDSTGLTAWLKNNADAVSAYNAAHGKSCILMCYEGSIEYAAPAGAANRDTRSHDIQYSPGFYDVEQGWARICQLAGVVAAHIYALGIGWPVSWGVYHLRTQKHSRGDGTGGAANNRQLTITPGSPGYIGGSTLKQDRRADSVRGQAIRDWLSSLGPAPVLPTAVRFALSWFGRWFGR